MFSLPFDFNWYSNWLSVGIMRNSKNLKGLKLGCRIFELCQLFCPKSFWQTKKYFKTPNFFFRYMTFASFLLHKIILLHKITTKNYLVTKKWFRITKYFYMDKNGFLKLSFNFTLILKLHKQKDYTKTNCTYCEGCLIHCVTWEE